ncbi:MAG: hypothetical protein O2783_03310 [Chloroflexi bacterium]|nr:hypothetical protein [Chloroflexota bacterium]
MNENAIQPNMQYALFCSDFIENAGQVSILGVLDGADVRGAIQRSQTMPQTMPKKIFPLKLVLGINAPEGAHKVKLGIKKPSGGIMTTVDLEGFEIRPGETVHRCIASLDMEVSENGTYTFTVFLDGDQIGWAVLPMSFTVDFID